MISFLLICPIVASALYPPARGVTSPILKGSEVPTHPGPIGYIYNPFGACPEELPHHPPPLKAGWLVAIGAPRGRRGVPPGSPPWEQHPRNPQTGKIILILFVIFDHC